MPSTTIPGTNAPYPLLWSSTATNRTGPMKRQAAPSEMTALGPI